MRSAHRVDRRGRWPPVVFHEPAWWSACARSMVQRAAGLADCLAGLTLIHPRVTIETRSFTPPAVGSFGVWAARAVAFAEGMLRGPNHREAPIADCK